MKLIGISEKNANEKKVRGEEGTEEPNNLSAMGQQSYRHYKPLAMTCKYT